MANNKIINTRILSKIDTSSEWSRLDPVLLNGEKIVVDFGTGAHPRYREKIGDGQSKYSQLPFIDENGVSVSLYDDDVVNLEHADGSTGPKYTTNSVSIVGKHHEEYNDSHGKRIEYDSSNTTSAIGPGETKVIKLPQFKVNEYGHVIEAEDSDIIIEVPNAPSVGDIVEGLGSGVEYLGVVSSLIGLTTTASKGDFYRVVVEFTSGNVTAHVGDLVVAEVDNPTRNIFESSEDAAADNGWVVIHCHSDTDSDTQSFLSTTNDTTKGVLTLTEKDKLGNTIRTDNVNIVEDGIINVTSDGNNNITVSTKNITLGETDKSLSAFNGQAKANYSIATGSNDNSSIIPIVGETLANKVEVNNPISSGVGSIASGAGAEATSAGAIAVGSLTRVGVQGFYWSDIIWNDNGSATITLSTKQGSADWTNAPTIDWVAKKDGIIGIGDYVGDRISIVNDAKYPACATITKVDTTNHKITVDKLPFTEKKTPSMVLPDDYTIFACGRIDITTGETEFDSTSDLTHSRWYPRSGCVTIGWAGTAFGVENLVSGSAGFASGWNNWQAGDFGAVFGRDNISGYDCLTAGMNNNNKGLNAIIVGNNIELKSNCINSAGFGRDHILEHDAVFAAGSTHTVKSYAGSAIGSSNLVNGYASTAIGLALETNKQSQLVVGQFNNASTMNNNGTAQFVVGIGSSRDATANGLILYRDGRLEIGADPKNNKEVVTLNYLNSTISPINTKITTIEDDLKTSLKDPKAIFGRARQLYIGTSNGLSQYSLVYGNTETKQEIEESNKLADTDSIRNVLDGQDITRENNVVIGGANYVHGPSNLVLGEYNTVDYSEKFCLVAGTENEIANSASMATVLGKGTRTGGIYSFAGNYKTNARFKATTTFGLGTVSNFIGQFVVGRSNIDSNKSINTAKYGYSIDDVKKAIFVVGNGKADDGTDFGTGSGVTEYELDIRNTNNNYRSNAFMVLSDGRAIVGANPINKMDVATKEYVDSKAGAGGVSIDNFDTKYFVQAGSTITLNLSALLEQEW